MQLDLVDKKILGFLQEDNKQTNKLLSLKLNLSVTAVYERIKKLERLGIIKKNVCLLDKNKINLDFVAFCHIKLVQHSKDYVIKFEEEVTKLKEVLECYHISGDYDYLLKVIVANIKYKQLMLRTIVVQGYLNREISDLLTTCDFVLCLCNSPKRF